MAREKRRRSRRVVGNDFRNSGDDGSWRIDFDGRKTLFVK
jgi:hypothetical protein